MPVSHAQALFASYTFFLADVLRGKDPGLAALGATAFALPRVLPPLPAPPRPVHRASAPAPRSRSAAVDPKTAARLAFLDGKAGHPDTPEEEARTAAVLAARIRYRLKHGGK
jgi:hypothetical protein